MIKKTNIKVLICLIFLIIIFGFIIYKLVMLQKYKTESIALKNDSIFSETLNIKYNDNNDFIKYEEMMYYDFFSDYVDKDDSNLKVKYDENGNVSSYYSITKDKQYIHMLNINSFVITNDSTNNDYSTEQSMIDFLNDCGVKNDIDLLKYIKDNYYLNSGMFTTLKAIKRNYILNSFAQVALPEFDSISLINGDKINGYLINSSIKEIHLLHNDSQYIITLGGNDLTNNEFINGLLETISFN